MSQPVPSLSTFGFIQNPAEKVDLLLTHFVYADKSQSPLFGKNVASLPYILQQNSNNIAAACADMQRDLSAYIGRYFNEGVSVDATYTEEDPDKSNTQIRIKLFITVVESGATYQVTKLLRTVDGRFKEFITLNNEDVTT